MRYAFVSDIHANLQAWRAVSADIDIRQVDEVICLGDVVGYGPKPSETLREIHAKTRTFIMGNHDAVVADILDSDLFNEEAQRMIEWTKKQLSPKARSFFAQMPYTVDIECAGFTAICVHGAMHPPESFYYIYTEEDARMTWDACEAPLVFVGHTHEPRADFLQPDGSYFCGAPEDFAFDPSIRTIVNVGSVGLPRSQDPRACYAIFDTETNVLSWRRVEYSIEELTQDIHSTFGKDASRALAIFEHAAEVSQDEEFSPKLIASTQSIKMAKSRMRRIQEERLTKQPMTKEKKVTLIAAVLILLSLLLLGAVGFAVLYEKQKQAERRREEELSKLDEEDRKFRSSPTPPTTTSRPATATKPETDNGNSTTGRTRANKYTEEDYQKMAKLVAANRPDEDTGPATQPDDKADPKKQPDGDSDPQDQVPNSGDQIKGIDLSQEVLESAEYQLLYELDLAKLKHDITYDKNNSGTLTGWPVRIAYCLELKKAAGPLKYVYVSMDAFTRDLKKMGIPDFKSKAEFQDGLKNLTVVSNVKRVTQGTGIEGNIEFWPYNYGKGNIDKVQGATENTFDIGDTCSWGSNYGSMQIHNTGAKQTVFAINKWNAGDAADIGIGNCPEGDPDWTHRKGRDKYTVKRLRVLVKMGEKPAQYDPKTDSGLAKQPTKKQNKKPEPKEPAPQTHASINVVASDHYFKADDRTKSTRIPKFTVEEGKGSKLVLVISWEGDKGVRARWKGKDLVPAARNKGGRNAVIMYLDDPEPGTDDIKVRFDKPTKALLGVVSLTGAAPGIALKEHKSKNTFDFLTEVPRCLMVGVCTANKEIGEITSAFNEDRSIYNGDSGSSFADAGVNFIMEEGKQSFSWRELNGKTGCSFAMAIFSPMEN